MKQGGFTLVETMIVLSVTAGLAVSALALISNRQNSSEFLVATNNARQQIEQILNETNGGYFADNNLSCIPGANLTPPASPTLSNGSTNPQGSNNGCVYLGKAVLLAVPGSSLDRYTTLLMAGNQYDASGQPVSQLSDAYPEAISNDGTANTTGLTQGSEQTTPFQNGLTVYSVHYSTDATAPSPGNTTGAFAYLSDISATGGGSISAAQQFKFYAIKNTATGMPPTTPFAPVAASAPGPPLAGVLSAINSFSTKYVPATEIDVCLTDGNNKSALIQIGNAGSSGRTAVTMDRKTSVDCS